MTLIALKQICDQLKEAIGLDGEHNVAALIDEDCETEVKGWTIVSVSNSGEIKPCTSQSFSTIKELMYSWLEKQGEEKVFIPRFRIGDIVKSKSQPMLDSRIIISIDKDCYRTKGGGCIGFAWEKDYELIEQKPAAWSEEDGNIRDNIIRDLKRLSGDMVSPNQAYQKEIQWLKSLKGRVGCEADCTTIKEWSEEDEKHIHSIISTIECCKAQFKEAIAVIEQYDSDLDYLKSLKDRYTWNPSEEQISVLSRSLKYINTISPNYCHVLEELLNQLKKLKG